MFFFETLAKDVALIKSLLRFKIMIPPAPVVTTLFPLKLKHPKSPKVPVCLFL